MIELEAIDFGGIKCCKDADHFSNLSQTVCRQLFKSPSNQLTTCLRLLANQNL